MRFREFIVKEDGFAYLDPNMSGGLARKGDKDAIAELQAWLNSNGFDAGEADGIYGRRTARAVKKFQRKAGLTVDGDAGPQTIRAMIKLGGGTAMTKKSLKKVKPVVDPGLAKNIEDNEIHQAARGQIEDFLGDEISDDDYEMLLRATAAEASPNPKERAGVLAVMLNRVRRNYGGHGSSVSAQLNAKNQFQAVTGVPGNRNPSRNYTNMSDSTGKEVARDIVQYLRGMDKSWMNFTANNPKAYGRGTNIDFMYAMRGAPNSEVIGQTVFGTA